MDARKATDLFRNADVLYRSGDFEEALGLLTELDKAFPRDRKLMFARARCLHKLERNLEALEQCDAILHMFEYNKAEILKERILEGQGPPSVMGLEASGSFEAPDLPLEATPRPSA